MHCALSFVSGSNSELEAGAGHGAEKRCRCTGGYRHRFIPAPAPLPAAVQSVSASLRAFCSGSPIPLCVFGKLMCTDQWKLSACAVAG